MDPQSLSLPCRFTHKSSHLCGKHPMSGPRVISRQEPHICPCFTAFSLAQLTRRPAYFWCLLATCLAATSVSTFPVISICSVRPKWRRSSDIQGTCAEKRGTGKCTSHYKVSRGDKVTEEGSLTSVSNSPQPTDPALTIYFCP